MEARGHLPPGYGGTSDQAPGTTPNGPSPAANGNLETLPLLLAVQEAEIERLERDNQRLASINVSLSHDLVASQQDIQRRRAQIISTPTEANIKIQVLLEKIAKTEAEKSSSESIKEELQQVHIEAQGLLKIHQELSGRIQQAHQELKIANADVKSLHGMQSELEIMKKEHQRLRTTFEYGKSQNMEKVEMLKVMENDLIAMSKKRDNLRAWVANAVRRARDMLAKADGAPSNQDPADGRIQ